MLREALEARLPIIGVHSTDLQKNILRTVKYYSGREVYIGNPGGFRAGEVCVYSGSSPPPLQLAYMQNAERGSTLLLVNPDPDPLILDTGPLQVPESLIYELVKPHVSDENLAIKIAKNSEGLNLREVAELLQIMLGVDKYNADLSTYVQLKNQFIAPTPGLHPLNLRAPTYIPEPAIASWLNIEGKALVSSSVPVELRPRGMLLSGPPGTGKTSAAKFIASVTDCPLYVADIGGMMERYLGQSEKALRDVLMQAERLSPCILLFDEVEKLFNSGDHDSGTSQRMLAKLLWWLQEHRSPVFTVMTTNDVAAIPPELIRAGRVDAHIRMQPLLNDGAVEDFISKIVARFNAEYGTSVTPDRIHIDDQPPISKADIEQAVKAAVAETFI